MKSKIIFTKQQIKMKWKEKKQMDVLISTKILAGKNKNKTRSYAFMHKGIYT